MDGYSVVKTDSGGLASRGESGAHALAYLVALGIKFVKIS